MNDMEKVACIDKHDIAAGSIVAFTISKCKFIVDRFGDAGKVCYLKSIPGGNITPVCTSTLSRALGRWSKLKDGKEAEVVGKMGLLQDIKEEAGGKRIIIQGGQQRDIEAEINKLFYMDPVPVKELAFIGQMFTRGQESRERAGLHASAVTVGEDAYCIRQQVLSLLYKQLQGEQEPIGLKKIFAAGDAIHEKYQRLFLRGGWSEPDDLDRTRKVREYELSFTPDAVIRTPDLFDGEDCVVEIKSVNSFTFQKMQEHASGKKQCLFYMRLLHVKHGIVLCEDKNTQDIKVFYYRWPGEGHEYKEITDGFVRRLEAIQEAKERVYEAGRMPKRHCKCPDITSDKAKVCPMRDVCFGKSKERI